MKCRIIVFICFREDIAKYDKLKKNYEDPTYEVVSNVFRALAGKKIIGSGSFQRSVHLHFIVKRCKPKPLLAERDTQVSKPISKPFKAISSSLNAISSSSLNNLL